MSLPLSSTAIGFIALTCAVLLTLILLLWLSLRLRRFTRGKNGSQLEDVLKDIVDTHTELLSFQKDMEKYVTLVEERQRKSVQGIHTVRFNPFHGTGDGGQQSFSTAFMSENGHGVVITSMAHRDRVSVFAKPIVQSASEYELTQEEKTAVAEALKKTRPSRTA